MTATLGPKVFSLAATSDSRVVGLDVTRELQVRILDLEPGVLTPDLRALS